MWFEEVPKGMGKVCQYKNEYAVIMDIVFLIESAH